MNKTLKLLKTNKLTHDVYELIFKSEELIDVLPGQFITFILPSWLRRAYSVSYTDWNNFEFIIKRLEQWRWGSKEICDLQIWTELAYIWPVGHFVLKEDNKPKLFIWTWTWFAPLYFQIKSALENNISAKIHFIFWVRFLEDVFYEEILKNFTNKYSNFTYWLYLSREDSENYYRWYVTDYFSIENISNYEEFYICGSPQMVIDARNKLENLRINKENIYFEQY